MYHILGPVQLPSYENYKKMFTALIETLQTQFGYYLPDLVQAVYLDGAKGGAKAVREIFPATLFRLCLQHIKKNLAKNSNKYRGPGSLRSIQHFCEWTAFLPNKYLFHALWDLFLERFKQNPKAHRYFTQHIVFRNAENLWDAYWRSDITSVIPGYSTYLSNALESFWGKIKKIMPMSMPRLNVTEVLTELDELLRDRFL